MAANNVPPAAVPAAQILPAPAPGQTPAPSGRGRGRGRGRGNKARGDGSKKGQSGDTKGFSVIMKKAISGVTMNITPERTYYIVNLPAWIEIAKGFDEFLHTLNRPRPSWKPPGYYCQWIYHAMLVKLQRVGIQSHQLQPTADLYSPSVFMLPQIYVTLIDQLGEFEIPSKRLTVNPLVTVELLNAIHSLRSESAAAAGHGAGAVFPLELNPDHWTDYIRTCYGLDLFHLACLSDLAARLHLNFSPPDASNFNLHEALAIMVNQHRAINGMALLTGAQHIAIRDMAAPGIMNSFQPQAAVVAIPQAPAAFTAAFTDTIAQFQRAFAPMANDPPLPYSTHPPSRPVYELKGEETAMARHFTLAEPSCSSIGSKAPCVVTHTSNNGETHGETVFEATTPTEFILGIMINNKEVPLTARNTIFNVSNPHNRELHFQSDLLSDTPQELLATTLMESLRGRP